MLLPVALMFGIALPRATTTKITKPPPSPPTTTCSSCLRLPNNLRLSGEGVLAEYYHFVTDFAPVLLEDVSQRDYPLRTFLTPFLEYFRFLLPSWIRDFYVHPHPPQCTVIYGNGPKMLFNNHPGRKDYGIPAKWEFLFGTPFNLRYEYKGAKAPLPAECPEVNWNASWGKWASGPAKRFVDLRAHAHQQAGVDSSAPPAGVVLIKRGKFGRMRRSLDDIFYDAAAKALGDRAIEYQVIDMEKMSIQDQVTTFANAKVVVGQHGAGLSNINWMKDGTTVIELGVRHFLCYENLARAVNLNYVAFTPTEWTSDLDNLLRFHRALKQNATLPPHLDNAFKQGALQLAALAGLGKLGGRMDWKCPSMASACAARSNTNQ